MSFKILHGGRIRYSADIDTSAAYSGVNIWNKGQVLNLQLTSYASKCDDVDSTLVFGLALDHRVSSADDETSASGKVGMLLDEAVIETDQLASGVSNFEEGQDLYSDTSGNVTNVDGGSARVLGKCLTPLQSDGTIKFFHTVQYLE